MNFFIFKKTKITIFMVFLFLLPFCGDRKFTKNQYSYLMKKHPATDVQTYPQKNKNWFDRVYNIDEIRISYMKEINQIDGFPQVPFPTTSLDEMKSKLILISKELHPKVSDILNKYVFAIYFCENLGGTGITGFIYNEKSGEPIGGFIIIDSKVIQRKANDWITYKENSVFSKKSMDLKIVIEEEKSNTIENAIRYILLHELGHIVSNTLKITPDFRNQYWQIEHPYFQNVWISEKKSIYDKSIFPYRPEVSFYASQDNQIDLDSDWNKIYPALNQTNFSTLYGAINPHDHFAEAFVSYIHCIIDKRPWELKITQNNEVVFSMKNRIFEQDKEKEFIRKIIFE